MPTSNPSSGPASAPPYGASYHVFNPSVIAKRVALGFKNPIRIQSEMAWGTGNPLFEWHQSQGASQIECMQLRKESESPFYHEYVSFRLSNTRCFRIDRRQLPDEQSPVNCMGEEGVEPFDTIEEIEDIEDSMYNPSECLVQLDFRRNASLNNITSITRSIARHKWARVYTLQKYNCYFYAQTVLLCTLCCEYDWEAECIWLPPKEQWRSYTSRLTTLFFPKDEPITPLRFLRGGDGVNIKLLSSQLIASQYTHQTRPNLEPAPSAGGEVGTTGPGGMSESYGIIEETGPLHDHPATEVGGSQSQLASQRHPAVNGWEELRGLYALLPATVGLEKFYSHVMNDLRFKQNLTGFMGSNATQQRPVNNSWKWLQATTSFVSSIIMGSILNIPPLRAPCQDLLDALVELDIFKRMNPRATEQVVEREVTIEELLAHLSEMINMHSLRVLDYGPLLWKDEAWRLEWGIKSAMNDIWAEIVHSTREPDYPEQDETNM